MNTRDVIRVSSVQPQKDDYYGEDGILYCGICNEAKEALFPPNLILGGLRKHPLDCACRRKEKAEEERKIQERMHRQTVDNLQRECFSDSLMRGWTFENASLENDRVRKCRKYVDQWETVRERNIGLLFWGKVGTGKSYLAGCIANALMEQEIPVRMTNLAAVINYGFDGRYDFIRKLCSYPLLILDDFGMERDTSFGIETVYEVIDTRYLSNKPIIVTTNLPLAALKNPCDTNHRRIYDRLLTMTVPVHFDGDSLRADQQRQNMELMKELFQEREA